MRIAVVYPVHPGVRHISAVRCWRFARELAQRGHHVSYVTGRAPLDALALDAPPRLRLIELPGFNPQPPATGLARRFRTAVAMLRDGGHSRDWVQAAVQAVGHSEQPPEVMWTTYGRLEGVVATRRAARRLRVPWVLDIKDNPEIFVPNLLRSPLALRLRGWSALTSNADYHAVRAQAWLGQRPTTVYSGVDDAFFSRQPDTDPRFIITLAGSLYDADWLAILLQGVAEWRARLSPEFRSSCLLRYIGGEAEMFESVAGQHAPSIARECLPFAGVEALAAACRGSAVNAYVVLGRGFHHKLLELLATGRPVLTVPHELPEAAALAQEVGGRLCGATSPAQVADALTQFHTQWSRDGLAAPVSSRMGHYTWQAQAQVLERVLNDVR